jgi:hypothetical protein
LTPTIGETQAGDASVGLQRATAASPWLSARSALDVIPIRHPVIEALGHHPTSDCAERFWLPVIGPSALWAHRRLTAGFAAHRSGYQLDLSTLGREIGLGAGTGRNSPIVRTLARLVDFQLAEIIDDRLDVYTSLPPLTRRQAARLPDHLAQRHWELAGRNHDGLRRTGGLGLEADR